MAYEKQIPEPEQLSKFDIKNAWDDNELLFHGNETAGKFEAEVGQVLDSGHCFSIFGGVVFKAVGCQMFFSHFSSRRNVDTEAWKQKPLAKVRIHPQICPKS